MDNIWIIYIYIYIYIWIVDLLMVSSQDYVLSHATFHSDSVIRRFYHQCHWRA